MTGSNVLAAASVFALCGDEKKAAALVAEVGKSRPLDTLVQAEWIPLIKAFAKSATETAPLPSKL